MMKIVIDARFWGPRHTGLGIYTQSLVEALASIDQENHYVLLVSSDDYDTISLPSNFKRKIVNLPAYSLAEQLILPWVLYRIRPDLVHFPSINVPVLYFGNYVVTVHDLIKHFFRGKETTTKNGFIYWLKFFSYLAVFRWTVWWSKKIIVPSQSVADELNARYPLLPEKAKVIYEAAVVETGASEDIGTLGLPDQFAIYTGNAYPHKNLGRLIKAWKAIFEKTKTELVLVGGRSVFSSRIQDLITQEKASLYVKFLGFVTPNQLSVVYQKAVVYVFPSLSEGFGLPGLDAMKLGLPVVCSNISALKEIYGDAAVYFDPEDLGDMQKQIIQVILSTTLREKLIARGHKREKLYSWLRAAKETLNIYQESQ